MSLCVRMWFLLVFRVVRTVHAKMKKTGKFLKNHTGPGNTVAFKGTRPYKLFSGSDDSTINLNKGPPFQFEKKLTVSQKSYFRGFWERRSPSRELRGLDNLHQSPSEFSKPQIFQFFTKSKNRKFSQKTQKWAKNGTYSFKPFPTPLKAHLNPY